MSARARVCGILYLVALAGYGLQAVGIGGAPARAIFEPWVYVGLLVAASASCLARGILVEQERLAWTVIGAGLCAWTAGDVYWSLELAALAEPPFPSPADPLYLAFYPACYAGLGLLARARLLSRDHGEDQRSLWLDGLVAALATAGVAVAALYAPILQSTGGEAAAVATNLAYPLGDLLLLVLVVGIFALTGWRPGWAWGTLALALGLSAVVDVLFLYATTAGVYQEGGLIDLGWLTAIGLLALAAWRAPAPLQRRRLEGLAVTVVPILFGGASIALLVAGEATGIAPLASALAIAALVALLVRVLLTIVENRRLVDRVRREATTDLLTGTGNRRRLMRDLEDRLQAARPGDGWLLAFFDLNGFKRYNDTFGHQAGDALLARVGAALSDSAARFAGTAYRLGGDEFCALVPAGALAPAVVMSELSAALSERGPSFEITSASGIVLIPDEATDPDHALQLADERMYACKHPRGSAIATQARNALMQALQEREPELGDHVRGVADLAVAVGRELGMDAEQIDELRRAAELHDVGKMAIPDAVLHKRGPLDDDEWRLMHQHTLIGERILSTVPALRPVARIVRSSHEHWDGSGYPDALRGDEIPLGSRVVLVCDAYNAMTTARAYRAAMSPQDAVDELVRRAGEQFDPAVVQMFCEQLAAAGPDPRSYASRLPTS